jgi:hypothetical protein
MSPPEEVVFFENLYDPDPKLSGHTSSGSGVSATGATGSRVKPPVSHASSDPLQSRSLRLEW